MSEYEDVVVDEDLNREVEQQWDLRLAAMNALIRAPQMHAVCEGLFAAIVQWVGGMGFSPSPGNASRWERTREGFRQECLILPGRGDAALKIGHRVCLPCGTKQQPRWVILPNSDYFPSLSMLLSCLTIGLDTQCPEPRRHS